MDNPNKDFDQRDTDSESSSGSSFSFLSSRSLSLSESEESDPEEKERKESKEGKVDGRKVTEISENLAPRRHQNLQDSVEHQSIRNNRSRTNKTQNPNTGLLRSHLEFQPNQRSGFSRDYRTDNRHRSPIRRFNQPGCSDSWRQDLGYDGSDEDYTLEVATTKPSLYRAQPDSIRKVHSRLPKTIPIARVAPMYQNGRLVRLPGDCFEVHRDVEHRHSVQAARNQHRTRPEAPVNQQVELGHSVNDSQRSPFWARIPPPVHPRVESSQPGVQAHRGSHSRGYPDAHSRAQLAEPDMFHRSRHVVEAPQQVHPRIEHAYSGDEAPRSQNSARGYPEAHRRVEFAHQDDQPHRVQNVATVLPPVQSREEHSHLRNGAHQTQHFAGGQRNLQCSQPRNENHQFQHSSGGQPGFSPGVQYGHEQYRTQQYSRVQPGHHPGNEPIRNYHFSRAPSEFDSRDHGRSQYDQPYSSEFHPEAYQRVESTYRRNDSQRSQYSPGVFHHGVEASHSQGNHFNMPNSRNSRGMMTAPPQFFLNDDRNAFMSNSGLHHQHNTTNNQHNCGMEPVSILQPEPPVRRDPNRKSRRVTFSLPYEATKRDSERNKYTRSEMLPAPTRQPEPPVRMDPSEPVLSATFTFKYEDEMTPEPTLQPLSSTGNSNQGSISFNPQAYRQKKIQESQRKQVIETPILRSAPVRGNPRWGYYPNTGFPNEDHFQPDGMPAFVTTRSAPSTSSPRGRIAPREHTEPSTHKRTD